MHDMSGATAPKRHRPGQYARRLETGRPAITISIDVKILETMDELAKMTRDTRSGVIAEAIEALARRKGVL